MAESFKAIREELTVSKLRFYSIGIVASNKALSSKIVEVVPTEEVPLVNGEITSYAKDYDAKAVNSLGGSYESSVKTTASISAQWLALGSDNRITAPDVRRGEMVMLYQFDHVDKYYWATLSEDITLRKLETVVYAFSATADEAKGTTADTTYYLEISTHKKLVHFHTSKSDKEPFGYDIQLNTKDGYLTITDDAGNFIHLNSAERRIELKNVDGNHFDMHQGTIDINTPTVINISVPTLNISTKNTNLVGNDAINLVGGGITLTGSAIGVNGNSSVTIASPATDIS